MPLQPSEIVQLRIGNRPLVPGRILWRLEPYIALELEWDRVGSIPEDATLHLLFEQKQKFVCQKTSLQGILDRPAAELPSPDQTVSMDLEAASQRMVIVLEVQGNPETADNRACYRVRTTTSAIQIRFADRNDCDLMDISQTGFGIISDQQLAEGTVVQACLPGDGCEVTGAVRVQSVRQLRSGRFRYGVTCLEPAAQKACVDLTMSLQRERLKRLAGQI